MVRSRRCGADGDLAWAIALFAQLGAQHLDDVALRNELRFEIEPGREVEITVRRTGKAIDAAVLETMRHARGGAPAFQRFERNTDFGHDGDPIWTTGNSTSIP